MVMKVVGVEGGLKMVYPARLTLCSQAKMKARLDSKKKKKTPSLK